MSLSTSRRPKTLEHAFDQVEEYVLTEPSSRAASGVAIQLMKAVDCRVGFASSQ
jgi:hypothetical protein